MSNDLITALDLGSTKVACLTGEIDDDGGLSILAAATVPCQGLRRGVIMDFQATASAIETAVRKVQQATGQDVQSVVVSVGGQQVEGLSSQGFVPLFPRGRSITRDDVLQVVNHSRQVSVPHGKEQIQALPKEFNVDGGPPTRYPIGAVGSRLEANTYIVLAQTKHVENLERSVTMAGKSVEAMVLQALASGLSVLSADERADGAAVIDIGGAATDFAIFEDGALMANGSVPVGGQLVTSDVGTLLKTDIQEAERLKTEFGTTLPGQVENGETVEIMQLGQTQLRPMQRKVLCEIVEARMNELAVMVQQQLDRHGVLGKLGGGIALTGGGSLLPGTVQLFEKTLGCPVRAARPHAVGTQSEIVNHPAMATVVGLALFAAQSYDDELSPAGGTGDWKDRVRTFWSLLSGRA